MNHARSNKRIIVSVVMALMMVMAMMPGMAFANTQAAVSENGAVTAVADTVTISSIPTTIAVGQQAQLEATYTSDVEVVHVEWVSSDTAVANVSKNKGVLNAVKAGTTTITAKLMTGAAGSTGGSVLATTAANVTVTPAAEYGFQGEGGNMLKVTDPADITHIAIATFNGKNLYSNEINTDVVASNNEITFGYTMSAGMNNFQETTFNTYKDDIGIYDASGTKVAPITFVGFANKIVTIKANVSRLEDGEYTLRFGPSVCGNNTSRNLNCYLEFAFVLVK